MANTRKRTRSDGTDFYQVRYKDSTSESGFGYKAFSRKKAAKAFEGKKTLEEEQNSIVPNEIIIRKRFSDAAKKWLDASSTTGRKGREPVENSTLRKYALHAKIINNIWIDPFLTKLTSDECDDLRDMLLEKYSRKYAKKILISFKSVLSHARHIRYMGHDPAENTNIMISQRSKKKDVTLIPTLQEVSLLLQTSNGNKNHKNGQTREAWQRYSPFFTTMILSGMRPCEILGLPWENVDFKNNTLKVTQDATEDLDIGLPKSGAAYRTIIMAEIAMEELQKWRRLCPESEHDLVFPNYLGNVESHTNISNRGWYPLLKQCGLVTKDGKTKYVLTSLRHVRASLEIHNGATPKEIQELMGHSSIKVTYDVYGHLFKDHEEQRATRANLVAKQLYQ